MTLEELKVVITAETKGLQKSLNAVKSSINTVNTTVKKMGSTVSSTVNKVNSTFKKFSLSIKNTFNSLLRTAGVFLSIAALLRLGKAAVKAASDLEEIQNVVDVAFGDGRKEINEWAKTTLSAFGLTEIAAKKYSSTLMAMSNSMGVARKNGSEMAKRLTELAGDLASFYNTSQDSAFNALEGVYTGQVRALKQYGIVLSEANLQEFAYTKGITKSVSAMNSAEKVLLRYQYVMHATSQIQGDFTRTAGTWANQMKVLSGQWTTFLSVLGTALKQVLSPLLKQLNNILAALITIARTVFTSLGVDFNVTAASVSAAADGAGDLADNLDDAGGSAKKLQNTLASFDELNVLNPKDSGSGSGAGAGGTGSDLDISDAIVTMTDTGDKALEGGLSGLLDRLNAWIINTMVPWLNEKAGWLADTINDAVKNIPWAKLGTTASNGLNAIIKALDTFWKKLDGYNVGKAIGTLLTNFTNNINTKTWGEKFGEKLKKIIDIGVGFVQTYDWKGLGNKIADWFNNVDWAGVGKKIAELISSTLIAAMELAIGIFDNAEGGKWQEFKDGFAEGWNTEGVKQAWEDLKSSFGDSNIFTELKTSLDQLNDTLNTLISILGLVGIAWGILNLGSWITTGTGVIKSIKALVGDWKVLGGEVSAGGKIFDAFKLTAQNVGTGLGSLGKIIADVGLVKIGVLTAGIAAAIASMILAYNKSEEVREYIDGIWNGHVVPMWNQIKQICVDIWENSLKPLWEAIKGLFKTLWDDILQPFLVAIGSVLDYLVGGVVFIATYVIGPIIQGALLLLQQIIDIITAIIGALDGVIQFIVGFVQTIGALFNGDLGGVLNGLKKMWDGLCKFLINAFDAFLKLFGLDINDIIKMVQDVSNWFKGLGQAISDGFKGGVNGVIGFLNKVIGAVQSAINWLVGGINKFRINVPSWVPVIGGKSFGFNLGYVSLKTIPYLANGGVIDEPTMAMVGEYSNAKNNPEIVTPKNLLEQVINTSNEELINTLIQLNRQLISTIENKDTTVRIGDDDIANSVIRSNQGSIRRTGKALLSY